MIMMIMMMMLDCRRLLGITQRRNSCYRISNAPKSTLALNLSALTSNHTQSPSGNVEVTGNGWLVLTLFHSGCFAV